ncbi:MAG: serine hydrolase [Deltaproteobacteria bacterium]|nr:serine hydrolase [Deltaproteobacteria bacterium]
MAVLLVLASALAGAIARVAAAAEPPAAEPAEGGEALAVRWTQSIEEAIRRVSQRFKGRIALYAIDPELGVRAGHDFERPSYLASGVKVTFMLGVFSQAHAGQLSLDEELTYDDEAVRDGAPVLKPKRIGSRLKIRELLDAMIRHSDNSASDMLARRVGLSNIQRELVESGFDGFTPLTYLIDVRRGILREVDLHADDFTPAQIRDIRYVVGWQAQAAKLTQVLGRPPGTYRKEELQAAFDRYYEIGVNSARLDSVAAIFERMLRRELVSPEASDAMLELLSDVKTSKHRILGKLPPGVRVRHKTGSQYERICDLGIIDLPDRHPLIVTLCLAGGNDRNLAEATLAELARHVYDLAVTAHRGHATARKDSR